MTIFVDTSALYALLDAADPEHGSARSAFERLKDADEELVTHSSVIVEAMALVHRRLGCDAVDRLVDDILPLIDVRWVGPALHEVGLAAFRASRSRTSLVDWTSFGRCVRSGWSGRSLFDSDFARPGFRLVA